MENNKIEVEYPNVTKKDKLKQLNKQLQEKREYLECLSKLHPSYQFTIGEINQIKQQINKLLK